MPSQILHVVLSDMGIAVMVYIQALVGQGIGW